MSRIRGIMQRSPLEIVVGIDIGAALDQELARVEITIAGGDHERRFEVLVPDVDGQTELERASRRVLQSPRLAALLKC